MSQKVVTLTGSRSFQDLGTVGQNVAQLAGNVQSINQILDVGLRNTHNYSDAFLRVSDLVGLGYATLTGNQLFAAGTGGGGSGTVTAIDSITGVGSSGSPLQLSGDVLTPGANQLYGTNGAGTRGWYAQGGASSPLTTKGDIYGYNTGNARVPVGTDGQVLTADSTNALGVSWQPAAGGLTYAQASAITSMRI